MYYYFSAEQNTKCNNIKQQTLRGKERLDSQSRNGMEEKHRANYEREKQTAKQLAHERFEEKSMTGGYIGVGISFASSLQGGAWCC